MQHAAEVIDAFTQLSVRPRLSRLSRSDLVTSHGEDLADRERPSIHRGQVGALARSSLRQPAGGDGNGGVIRAYSRGALILSPRRDREAKCQDSLLTRPPSGSRGY
jgi:hypothetical protein